MNQPKELKELNTKVFDLASDYISEPDALTEAFKKIRTVLIKSCEEEPKHNTREGV